VTASTVSIARFDGSLESIGRAIKLCSGFEKLNTADRVLVKPNITFSGWIQIPPYGMVTTSKAVEGILRMLAEHGCRNVSVGEGTVVGMVGSNTRKGFKYTGIERVTKKYGARLLDLNEEPFESRELDGVRVGISKAALDADFLINVPVLKTHPQVKASLGLKNLKGCLDSASRKRFHLKGLDHLICLLNRLLECQLTVIDGIYMLEKGADTLMGTAHRKDVIIASRDTFACDCVGATILGIEPSQVGYLKEYAETTNRPIDLGAIQVVGEDMESIKERVDCEPGTAEDLLGPVGITGLSVSPPVQRLCSGCYSNLALAVAIFSKVNSNIDLGDTRIYCGRIQVSKGTGQRIILYGDCAISENGTDEHAIKISGCPPSAMNTVLSLMKTLLPRSRILTALLLHSPKLLGLRAGLYSGSLPKWERYQPPEFDRSHFR